MNKNSPKKGNTFDQIKYKKSTSEQGSYKISNGIRIFYSIVKSRMLVYVFAIVGFGSYLISLGVNFPEIHVMLRLVVSVYLLALATYVYNDLTDFRVDNVNKRSTTYSKEQSKYKTTKYITAVLFVSSTAIAFSINYLVGASSIIFIILGILYSHPYTHLKDRFVVKTIVTAAGGAIASLMGSFATGGLSYLAGITSVMVFLFWFTLGPLGDIGDIRGDRAGGRRTIPIVLGLKKTFVLMMGAVLSIACMIFLAHYVVGLHPIGVIAGILICGYVIFQLQRVSKKHEDRMIIKNTRTSLRYSVFGIQIAIFFGLICKNILL